MRCKKCRCLNPKPHIQALTSIQQAPLSNFWGDTVSLNRITANTLKKEHQPHDTKQQSPLPKSPSPKKDSRPLISTIPARLPTRKKKASPPPLETSLVSRSNIGPKPHQSIAGVK
ncbi:MAG: hypothetical protein CL920_18710 [Deltaproteobacteria bacterium]|nr:hypothetical protein [Deltaproteobacteria bacterium]MBU50716.1 hypothetical protein [Deltaproteobacteria bacterium]